VIRLVHGHMHSFSGANPWHRFKGWCLSKLTNFFKSASHILEGYGKLDKNELQILCTFEQNVMHKISFRHYITGGLL